MKKIWMILLPTILGFGVPALTLDKGAPAKKTSVSLEVLNPRGEIPPPPFFAPSARVADLTGKKIGIYWIGKAGGNNFFDGIESLLKEKYPTVTVLRYRGPFDLGEKRAAEIAKEVGPASRSPWPNV